jgi:hypothetical protein
MGALGWTFALLFSAACPPANRPMLAEVLYDAAGGDTGHEFVEIVNPLAAAVPLAGLRLEAGDGAGPDRWTLRWTGGTGDTIPAGGRFVIGGAAVSPPADAIVTLAIQNGPDAIRLVWPDGWIETLGFGELEHDGYFCGEPAADAPSGMSLARVPDDAASGTNAVDFRVSLPTPGRANQPSRDVLVEPGSIALVPERPLPGTSARLGARVRNAGRESLAADSVTLSVEGAGVAGAHALGAIGPGETVEAGALLGPLPAGKHVLRLRVTLRGDAASANDADSLRVRIGPGPLVAREIQFHPAGGEGEWVECLNAGPAALDPATYRIADRSGTQGTPRGGSGLLAPDSLVLFVQSRAGMMSRFPSLDPARVWEVAPWPALNNSNDVTGVADHVRLHEPDATLSDHVAYSASGVPNGVPLEWRGGAWWPSLAPAGTPLAPPVNPASVKGTFAFTAHRIAHPGVPAPFAWDLPWPAGRATLTVYDLSGRRVARPFIDLSVPARGERVLDTSNLPAGVYVVAFEVRPSGAGDPVVARAPLRIDGRAR